MRRVLRKIACNERDLGDVSTLADSSVVEQLFDNRCCAAVWPPGASNTVWPQYKLQFWKEKDESELRMKFRIMLAGRQNEKKQKKTLRNC